MTVQEWVNGFAKELTIDTNSVNRLWQKINAHCVSNGVSVDMEKSDLEHGILKVVDYKDLIPLNGIEIRIIKNETGVYSRVYVDGIRLDGREPTTEFMIELG